MSPVWQNRFISPSILATIGLGQVPLARQWPIYWLSLVDPDLPG
jgi:hypothetical protein